jgi:cytidylate kinase
MIITIDGPAGSGKSTAARKLAAKLAIAYLDTGAMYRALALAALQKGVRLKDDEALVEVARKSNVHVECGPTHTRVFLNDDDVSEAVRSMAVNQATSFVARIPRIREMLVEKQRATGRTAGRWSEAATRAASYFPTRLKFSSTPALKTGHAAIRVDRRRRRASYEMIMENLRERDSNDRAAMGALLEPATASVSIQRT